MNQIILIIIGGALLIFVVILLIDLIDLSFNDFLDKYLRKTLWIWLPFHALRRLSREFKEKYMK